MTGSRKTRIRLAVFFSLFPVWQRSAHRLFQADARFHGADSGDGQYQRFTLRRVSRLSSQIRVFRLSISLFSPGSVTFILCSYSLCGGDQSRLSFTDGDRQACIKTGLIPAGHLQDRPLYPAYAAGIRQLQAGGTVQTDHVGRFPQGVMTVTQLQLHRVTGSRLA